MMIPEILLLLTLVVQLISFPVFLEIAGKAKWKGYIPFYSWFAVLKIIQRPWWWGILFFVPGVNLIMFAVLHIEIANAFGKRSFKDHLMATFLPFVFLPMLAFKETPEFVGPVKWKDHKKTMYQEWGHAIVFAVVAATIIRTFFIEAYTIPTPSMEKSLLVGDYLFVSKINYGPKLPNTPVAVPFTHHSLPLTAGTPAYLEWFKLPYFRLPGFGKVERFDPVVFNFPDGDTVLVAMQQQGLNQTSRDQAMNFSENRGEYSGASVRRAKELLLKHEDYVVRPVDKKENYIKRCVGLPGEYLEVRSGMVYINDQAIEQPEDMQFGYIVKTKDRLNPTFLKQQFNITGSDIQYNSNTQAYHIPMSMDIAEKLSKLDFVISIEKEETQRGEYLKGARLPIFPNHPSYDWTEDFFGPLHIPKSGETIELNMENLPLYRKAITAYEKNTLEMKDGEIFINGELATSYTFKMDYFFMMGDNRHRSADSRFWGMVPEDHVVGKAVFIWFSKDAETGIRWNRIFSFAN
jgi:signal peptidase I